MSIGAMNIAVQFFEQNLITIYFFYGLAFFAMGLALIVAIFRTKQSIDVDQLSSLKG